MYVCVCIYVYITFACNTSRARPGSAENVCTVGKAIFDRSMGAGKARLLGAVGADFRMTSLLKRIREVQLPGHMEVCKKRFLGGCMCLCVCMYVCCACCALLKRIREVQLPGHTEVCVCVCVCVCMYVVVASLCSLYGGSYGGICVYVCMYVCMYVVFASVCLLYGGSYGGMCTCFCVYTVCA